MKDKLFLFSSIICIVLLAWMLDTFMQPKHCINSKFFSHLYIQKPDQSDTVTIPSCNEAPYFQHFDIGEYVTTRDFKNRIYQLEKALQPLSINFQPIKLKLANYKASDASVSKELLQVNFKQFLKPHFLEIAILKYQAGLSKTNNQHHYLSLLSMYSILNKKIVFNQKAFDFVDEILANLIQSNFKIQCVKKWVGKKLYLCRESNDKNLAQVIAELNFININAFDHFKRNLKSKVEIFRNSSFGKINLLAIKKINKNLDQNQTLIQFALKNKHKFVVDKNTKEVFFNSTIAEKYLTVASGCDKPELEFIVKKYKNSKKVLFLQSCHTDLIKHWEHLVNNKIQLFIESNPKLNYYYFHIPSIQLALNKNKLGKNLPNIFHWKAIRKGFSKDVIWPLAQFDGVIHYRP